MTMYDKNQIYYINEFLRENTEPLLDALELDYVKCGDRFTGCCPIHGGDNRSALNIRNGFWVCYTKHCEQVFPKNMIGFTRGVLSRNNGWTKRNKKMYSFPETLDWVVSTFKLDVEKAKSVNLETMQFSSSINLLQKQRNENKATITRGQIRVKLKIPPSQLLERGFSSEILNEYDIGLCLEKDKQMSNRIVVPVYDDSYNYMVGCLGRATVPVCDKCKSYHSGKCPRTEDLWKHRKWINSKGFYADSYLFNFWKAGRFIKEKNKVVIVEGPLDVLRLEQAGIRTSVGLFGSSMSDEQIVLLERIPIQHCIVLTDNDEAGNSAKTQIKEQCERMFKIHAPKYEGKDIGECSDNEIKRLKDFIEGL